MTGKITEIREYLLGDQQTATLTESPDTIHKSVTVRLDFDDSTLRLTGIGSYLARNINFPIEIFPADVKIGDEFTLYFERKK